MKALRRFRRRLSVLAVTLWANRTYRLGVEAAERRRAAAVGRGEEGGCVVYLAADPFRPGRLATYDKRQFKREKRAFGTAARLLTVNSLRRGCYYHTADKWGRGGLSERERETRRLSFVRERLRLARLGGG